MPESTTDHTDRTTRLLPLIALVIAAIALGLGVWNTVRTPEPATAEQSSTEATFTDEQRAADKQRVCTAFDTVRTGVSRNTNTPPPGGDTDVVGALAVAANARVSLLAGGQYLYAKVGPATPTDLADAAKRFADVLTDVGAAATAGIPNTDPTQAQRLRDADQLNTQVTDLCK